AARALHTDPAIAARRPRQRLGRAVAALRAARSPVAGGPGTSRPPGSVPPGLEGDASGSPRGPVAAPRPPRDRHSGTIGAIVGATERRSDRGRRTLRPTDRAEARNEAHPPLLNPHQDAGLSGLKGKPQTALQVLGETVVTGAHREDGTPGSLLAEVLDALDQ